MLEVLKIAGGVILVLLTVVLIHEGGHFVVGKLAGIRVDEFSVGFGPRLAKKTVGETTYSLRAIPAGGYVRMAGMLGLEGEADAGERNFYRASIPRRLATILAGVAVNLVFAGVVFTVLDTIPAGVSVSPGFPAQAAGVKDGDMILSVDGAHVVQDNSDAVTTALRAATAATAGAPVTLTVKGSEPVHTVSVRPVLTVINGVAPPTGSPAVAVTSLSQLPIADEFVVTALDGHPVGTGDPALLINDAHSVDGWLVNESTGGVGASFKGLAAHGVTDGPGAAGSVQAAWRVGIALPVPGAGGIGASTKYAGDGVVQALGDGFGQIPAFVTQTYSGIANLISTPNSGGLNGPNGLSGPVGIIRETATATDQGSRSLVGWIAFISLNLGFVNLLPVPFLDGGKAVLILLEAVRRKRLDPRREALIYAVGLALVVLFAIYVTIGDVSRSQ